MRLISQQPHGAIFSADTHAYANHAICQRPSHSNLQSEDERRQSCARWWEGGNGKRVGPVRKCNWIWNCRPLKIHDDLYVLYSWCDGRVPRASASGTTHIHGCSTNCYILITYRTSPERFYHDISFFLLPPSFLLVDFFFFLVSFYILLL